MNSHQIKTAILGKIREQQAVIDAGSITVDEANEVTARWCKALLSEDVETLKSIDDWMQANDAAAISNAASSVEMLKVSLASNLVHVPTKYVITDSDLISPSGFHPDDKVYIKNDVFIMTDSLPSSFSNNLKAYEV